jgi:SAM-dependent methyltransferase
MSIAYSPTFYKTYEDESAGSAAVIVPLVIEYVKPRKVLDVGCGIGTWLSAFEANGVEGIHGIDGDYVDRRLLKISPDRFTARDLKNRLDVPGAHYDLVVSLEVAEHLPESRAASFVATLTQLAPVVLFSAAIPFQGGDYHVNEQWPDYWANLFSQNGFTAIDCIRPRTWEEKQVAYYYSQNIVMYVKSDRLNEYSLLLKEYEKNPVCPRSLVHPLKWFEANDPHRQRLRNVLKAFPWAMVNTLSGRLARMRSRLMEMICL